MKILLKNTRTGLFLHAPGKWTSNPEDAYDFRFIDRAVRYVEVWELKNVEVAFAFDDPASVTTVSLERTAARYAAA